MYMSYIVRHVWQYYHNSVSCYALLSFSSYLYVMKILKTKLLQINFIKYFNSIIILFEAWKSSANSDNLVNQTVQQDLTTIPNEWRNVPSVPCKQMRLCRHCYHNQSIMQKSSLGKNNLGLNDLWLSRRQCCSKHKFAPI